MKKTMLYRYWGLYFALAFICQLAFGKCPVTFFAFPVNTALLLLGVVDLWILYKEKPGSRLCLLLSSPQSTFLLLGVTFVSCLMMGFGILLTPSSWWMTLTLIALLMHLLTVIYKGMDRKRPYKLRFALIHIGLFVALTGGLAGSADTREWRMAVTRDKPAQYAYDKNGEILKLTHRLQLQTFDVTYYPDGTPQNYTAQITIDGRPVTLEVNHPHSLSWADNLYLTDYEHTGSETGPRYCILQLVVEPWKYALWTGIWMLIAGSILLFAQGVPSLQRKGGNESC